MSILINKNTKVLVLGITGKSGKLQTEIMKRYGTNIVAGVTPGKEGKEVEGVPVYDFVEEAVNKHDINAAISFVPPPYAKDSCIEVIENNITFLVLTTEQIPEHDVVEIMKYAENKGTRILGPGSAGLISPGKCKLGVHPPNMYKEGHIGVISKSGALSYEVGKTLTENGIGQSTVVAIGGGPYWGLTQLNIIKSFQEDDETKMIVLLGEIGGTMEEDAAKFIKEKVNKPVIALIVGKSAPKGKSLGHAGAIIEGNLGTAESKINALREAGVYIAKNHMDIVEQIRKIEGK
ncbi:MAG TPA: succinate--CoA ligase subunit alpha [Candidatus Atribacteria bacterium]|nr:succinate--CoA ligase subunit alpha [Candidatus Atribacteria bacterium]